MRLFSTWCVFAAVNAQEDEEGCPVGSFPSTNGFCTDSPEFAKQLALDMFEVEAGSGEQTLGARKFPIGLSQGSSPFLGSMERTKRRSQRITMLYTKVNGNTRNPRMDPVNKSKPLRPKNFMKYINNYGCHCWTEGSSEGMGGSGSPVDGIDSVCKKLGRCHKCIGITYPDNCDPVTTKYRAALKKNSEGHTEIRCLNELNKKGTNNGDCKRDLCECDKAFAEGFADNFEEWSTDFWNLKDEELYSDSCQRLASQDSRSIPSPPNKCCGRFPDVKPFNDADKQCVDNKVYDNNWIP